jgi:hypothetical protein
MIVVFILELGRPIVDYEEATHLPKYFNCLVYYRYARVCRLILLGTLSTFLLPRTFSELQADIERSSFLIMIAKLTWYHTVGSCVTTQLETAVKGVGFGILGTDRGPETSAKIMFPCMIRCPNPVMCDNSVSQRHQNQGSGRILLNHIHKVQHRECERQRHVLQSATHSRFRAEIDKHQP